MDPLSPSLQTQTLPPPIGAMDHYAGALFSEPPIPTLINPPSREGKRGEEEWVILDRFVFRRDGGAKPLPENRTTVGSSTCIGVPFRVSLGLVPPPAASRFYLEWPGGPNEDIGIPCHLVAAHRGCVLFRLTSIVRSKARPQHLIYPDDYYIYRPATADLKRLPTCIRRTNPDGEREKKQSKLDLISESESSDSDSSELLESGGEIVLTEMMKRAEKAAREDYEERLAMGVDTDLLDQEVVRSSLEMEGVGLLCPERGDQEFIVAGLQVVKLKGKVSAELSLLHSTSVCDWVHMPLPIKCHSRYRLRHFCAQAVVPFGEDCLCWVDYCSGGIIIGKNMLEQTPILCHIPLPRSAPSRGCDMEKRCSVCATDGGRSLTFIEVVVDKDHRQQPGSSSGFTITSYNLIIATEEEGILWEKGSFMTSDEMWGLKAPGRVPREVPMFPLVCQDKPHIVHFQLSEWTDYLDTVTLVAVDMSARAVVSVCTHIKGEQELLGEDANVAGLRAGLLQPFIPATFSKFLIPGPVNLRKRKDQS